MVNNIQQRTELKIEQIFFFCEAIFALFCGFLYCNKVQTKKSNSTLNNRATL